MEGVLKILRLLYRLPLMLLHLVIGTPVTVACQYSWGQSKMLAGVSLAEITSRWWSSVICTIFGVRRRIKGDFVPGAQLVAANHISFLDISVFHSFATMGFVAKAEINGWPLLGGLARAGHTVFHKRGSHDSASGVAAAMVERLNEQRRVAIFPEGGILPGDGVKRFHARLFAAAIDAGKPVQPVMIRYLKDGARYDDITFLPGEHFAANVFRLLMQKTCIAEVQVLPLIDSTGKQRRQLAGEAERQVRKAYESEISDA
ncbi:MAG: 1-acyl-sn-glycerol-3-phosphate acyltransferase [Xanthomonadales bacterium]|jgi:1-acyl-sn-glycerol-3-phosphate acyltransferase|nr:1-acyl-sn-glycerol-3-phosphate acyltransferase [Xanthomonadales bacterium]MDH3940420.1 1-acyl-sn-glycerol-3-phosphate acyltransferase [Xanthomonadales bacterium]